MDSVDLVLMCIPADETSGAGDVFLSAEIAKHPKAKKFAVITKTDLISKEKLALRLAGIMDLAKGFTWDEIIPVSAAIHELSIFSRISIGLALRIFWITFSYLTGSKLPVITLS